MLLGLEHICPNDGGLYAIFNCVLARKPDFLNRCKCLLVGPASDCRRSDRRFEPAAFFQPLKVTRGTVAPIGANAMFLSAADSCRLVKEGFGWKDCNNIDLVAMSSGDDIDTLLVNRPTSDGYVSLDDWDSSSREAVEAITTALKTSMREQSAALGYPVEFVGWSLYPQVDHRRNVMFFANSISWNGDDTLNITLVKFDRYGFTAFKIVPASAALSGAQIAQVVDKVIEAYKPNPGSTYSEFASGDKVASYGAVGAFAGLLGVKYGKPAAAGILAFLAIFLKKAWLILLLPLVWLKKLFTRRPDNSRSLGD